MPKPTIDQILKTLDSLCHRIHMEPALMRSHMKELSTLLSGLDTKETTKYCWLEATIRQGQLNIFTQCCTQCADESLLCLLKVQEQNSYNLCFTHDIDKCICDLRAQCRHPIELVAYGHSKLTPNSLQQVLSDPQIQKSRWFPLTDIQFKQVVKTLKR